MVLTMVAYPRLPTNVLRSWLLPFFRPSRYEKMAFSDTALAFRRPASFHGHQELDAQGEDACCDRGGTFRPKHRLTEGTSRLRRSPIPSVGTIIRV